jgi:hypothetical protein
MAVEFVIISFDEFNALVFQTQIVIVCRQVAADDIRDVAVVINGYAIEAVYGFSNLMGAIRAFEPLRIVLCAVYVFYINKIKSDHPGKQDGKGMYA